MRGSVIFIMLSFLLITALLSGVITIPSVAAVTAPKPVLADYVDIEPAGPDLDIDLIQGISLVQVSNPHASENKVIITRRMNVTTTAYSSTPDQTDDTPFIAANGKQVHWGMVASNFLPFGTVVKFPKLYGERLFVVGDRMNERYNPWVSGEYRVDIWQESREEAKNFGLKRGVLMEIVKVVQ